MVQRKRTEAAPPGLHVAIIMDGNGRWAEARGWPRNAGHVAGAEAVRRVVTAARRRGLGALTLFAFSSDNWQRPPLEVAALMRLFRDTLAREVDRCVANGIRLSVIGRRDRLPAAVLDAIVVAEALTAHQSAMRLRLAVDYSARDTILEAARLAAGQLPERPAFESLLAAASSDPIGAPEVDLLIRSGGERRLSDFLLWESAYAELHFTDTMWPDFGEADLDEALSEFLSRERRFGRLPEASRTGTSEESP